MIKSDQLVTTSVVALLAVHTTVWIVGYFNNKLYCLFSFLNPVMAVMVIGFWAFNQLRIQQHFIEGREIIVLGLELVVALVSIFTILSHPASGSFKIIQYIVFGIHFIVLIAALTFMLTFKINKLM